MWSVQFPRVKLGLLTMLIQEPSLPTVRSRCQPFSEGAFTRRVDSPKPRGLENYLNLISQRAKIQGFVVYVPLLPITQFV